MPIPIRLRRAAEVRALRGAALAILAALAGVAAAGADTRIEVESSDLRAAEPTVSRHTLWLAGPNLRFESDAGNAAIYRRDAETVWWIDHRERRIRRIDRANAESLGRGVGQANTAARGYIEMLPPAQREAARKMLDSTLGTPVEVSDDLEIEKRDREQKFADVPCETLEVTRGETRVAEVCRADFDAARVDADSRASIEALVETLRAVVPSLAPDARRQDAVDGVEAFRELDGVPLHVRLYEGGKAVFEAKALAIEVREAPATAFELPDGYAQDMGL